MPTSSEALRDFLKKNDFDYVTRQVRDYKTSGARVSVPKGWMDVLIINIMHDRVEYLDVIRKELSVVTEMCDGMRAESGNVKGLLCGKIDFDKTGRDNAVCHKCVFGRKIVMYTELINKFYDSVDDDVLVNELSKRFDKRLPE